MAMASWLEDPNNEAIVLAEEDQHCLNIVVNSCVSAADQLKKAAREVEYFEPNYSNLTPESLESLSKIAQVFDESGDTELMKQASVIDELLLTVCAPKNEFARLKEAEDLKIEEIKKKYKGNREKFDEINNLSQASKEIDKSPIYSKEYRPLEFPLSTRHCPDHVGVGLIRINDNEWQCQMDKKIYNFATGYKLDNGSQVPGGDVSLQTDTDQAPPRAMFDTREQRLQSSRV